MIKKTAFAGLAAGLVLISVTGQGRNGLAAENHPPLKKSDRAFPEGSTAGPEPAVGVKEVPRPDGGKDIIYFSVTPESDRRTRDQAERNKLEKSLDLPGNFIILGR